jgi:hypothetical protein
MDGGGLNDGCVTMRDRDGDVINGHSGGDADDPRTVRRVSESN